MDGRRPRSSEAADVAWSVTSYLLAGMLVWGGLGWLVDRWRGSGPVFLPIGVLVGVAAALYLVHIRTQQTTGPLGLPDQLQTPRDTSGDTRRTHGSDPGGGETRSSDDR